MERGKGGGRAVRRLVRRLVKRQGKGQCLGAKRAVFGSKRARKEQGQWKGGGKPFPRGLTWGVSVDSSRLVRQLCPSQPGAPCRTSGLSRPRSHLFGPSTR